jgi:1,6-anhydro-N-acetylmuramate kinase
VSIETPEYAAMMRRMLRAWGERVADADPEDLAELIAFREQLDSVTGTAIARMRAERGASWADIARAGGITRQAAHERWARYGQDHQEPAQQPCA